MDILELKQREKIAELNSVEGERIELEKKYGQVWNTSELQQDYNVVGFGAPCVVVIRKSDGVKGSLFFQNRPRYYFSFKPA